MPSWALFSNTIFVSSTLTTASFTCPVGSLRSSNRACPRFYRSSVSANYSAPNVYSDNLKSPIHYDSLRVLEWDKLCDSVAFFARTSLGQEATKAQLWSLNQTYEESMKLLDETNAAVEMHKHGGCSLDFTGINLPLVKSAIRHARRSSPMEGNEAMAISSLLQYADSLQSNLKAAMKEDSDWYTRFMPLSDLIMGFIANQSLVRLIQKVIDEDGTVKDSASSTLKRARDQVRSLEQKLYQLMNSLVRNERKDTSFMEVSSIDGRWCIISVADQPSDFKGLLLSSGSGMGNVIEPLSAVPLNDELQQARASVMKAEGEVLSMLTERMQMDLDDIEKLLEIIVQLDAINARASYGLSYGAAHPDIFQPQVYNSSSLDPSLVKDQVSKGSNTITREWMLYLPKAYHPLLLQQHRENLEKAKKDLKNAIFKMRRKQHGEYMAREGDTDIDLPSLKSRVTALEQAPPVPVDFLISKKTRVLLITGPNTGGKTIGLKTIGLAAMMAKSGLHVLASESVQIPWFDSVFANIGDDQSLSQSLSTFSGHLKQISEIQAASTCQSLVLLDEVGAGTNPLEGAALGMSLLESFAETGASLTVATTHHGELKSLKYSNDAFENACMEFDEVNLKPTYKILWGVPGRSNAINIAAKLGLPGSIIDSARKLYGAASAEIDEVIIDLENIKRNYGDLLQKSQNHLMHSRVLYKNLLLAQRKITEHRREVRFKKMQEVSEAAIIARSILHKKARQFRTSAIQPLQPLAVSKSHSPPSRVSNTKSIAVEKNKLPKTLDNSTSSVGPIEKSPSEKPEFPKVGDTVYVSSLGRKVSVLSVDSCKEEIVVQAGFMKMKLKLIDLKR